MRIKEESILHPVKRLWYIWMLNFKHLSNTNYLNKTLLFEVKYVLKCVMGWWLVHVSGR